MHLRLTFLAGLLLIVPLASGEDTFSDSNCCPKSAHGNVQIEAVNRFGLQNLGGSSSFADGNGTLIFLPTLVVADVPVYNLPALHKPLRFTPQILVGIFLGTITRWNDAPIAAANPGIRLPSHRIIVVHRTDENAETLMWTDYLSKVSDRWNHSVGKGATVQWPVGIGVAGSDGVEREVSKTENSVGYLERLLAVQGNLPFADVQNAAGKFVHADVVSVAAAAAERIDSLDFRRFMSISNPSGDNAYPIAGFAGIIIPEQIPDVEKKKSLFSFVRWVLTNGQKTAIADGYVPVPAEVIRKELQLLDAMDR